MDNPTVALFVTCVVDAHRPSVGFATIELLEKAGCKVEVPQTQSCCGQPAYNSGASSMAKAIAKQVIENFEGFDYVVAPSGSCMGMIIKHYPSLLIDEPIWQRRAIALATKSYELVDFLVNVRGLRVTKQDQSQHVTYHDSCSGLRELAIHDQPRKLLADAGHSLSEMEEANVCCGFGGTFCVKYPDISTAIAGKKVENIINSGASVVTGGDLGCLINIAGKLQQQQSSIEVRHIAELLVSALSKNAIGKR